MKLSPSTLTELRAIKNTLTPETVALLASESAKFLEASALGIISDTFYLDILTSLLQTRHLEPIHMGAVATDIMNEWAERKVEPMSEQVRELLVMLAEEAGEVTQAVTKTLRHGINSYHPDDPSTTNKMNLEKEVTDLLVLLEQLVQHGVISGEIFKSSTHHTIWRKKLNYTHHQGMK